MVRNILNKLAVKLNRKKEGYAWFAGVYFIFFSLIIVVATVSYYMMGITNDDIEDVLTVSALGSLTYDKEEYALNKSYILLNPDDNYKTLKKLIGDNLGLTNVNGNEYTGTSTYLNLSEHNCTLLKVIFYNKYSDGRIVSYTYLGNSPKQTFTDYMDNTYTPIGDKVTSTSVYVVFQYPVHFNGNSILVKKMSYVALDKSADMP